MRDPRNYLRHPKGRGQIFDDAEVHLSATLSIESIAAQQAKLRDCSVTGKSYVAENARVFGGRITNSYVGGDIVIAGNPVIVASTVRGESISGEPHLTHCSLFDKAEICDDVHIIGNSTNETVIVSGSALVYGTAMLVGHFEVKGRMRINSGVWKRAPRHMDLGFVAVTESKTGAMVDCRDRSLQYWRKHGETLGERWGWERRQIVAALIAVEYVVNG